MSAIDQITRRLYVGGSMSLPAEFNTWENQTGPFGVRRLFYQWTQTSKEATEIASEHAVGRLPWVSFKAPVEGWAAVARGDFDADIIARAQRYSAMDQPTIVTFHHEPEDDGDAADWAAAYCRIGQLFLKHGALDVVAYCPVLMAWSWRPESGRNVFDWLRPDVLAYSDILGVDVYGGQTSTLHPNFVFQPVLDTAELLDIPVGIAESGATDLPSYDRSAWVSQMWEAVQADPNVIVWCYWNNWQFIQDTTSQAVWADIANSSLSTLLA